MKHFVIPAMLVGLFAGSAQADLTNYLQDFESLTPAADVADGTAPGSDALSADGYLGNGISWAGDVGDTSGFEFFYGNFPAPNFDGNAGFSGIVSGQGGAGQGNNQLNIFADYNLATAHGSTSAASWGENRVFIEQVIGTPDLGEEWTLSFDYLRATDGTTDFGPTGDTNTFAFVRVLDSISGSFATLDGSQIETTAAGTSWQSGSTSLTIDPSLNGQLLQFGFLVESQDQNGSGILYDNVSFAPAVAAIPEPSAAAAGLLLGCIGVMRRRRRR